ncbi:MAG: formate/nitrite transporter family protein [Gemmatimonadota bacterium]
MAPTAARGRSRRRVSTENRSEVTDPDTAGNLIGDGAHALERKAYLTLVDPRAGSRPASRIRGGQTPRHSKPASTTAPDTETAKGPATGTRFSAAEIHENVRLAAEEELRRPSVELLWSAIASGLTIGFSFVFAAWLSTLVAPDHAGFAVAMGYPLGFIFVVLARNQLFTENTLEPVIPLLNDRSLAMLRSVARLWAVVLLGNLAGALCFALLAARTPMFDAVMTGAMRAVAGKATAGGFWAVAYLGIFAGWLIALMAWLVSSTRSTGAQIVLVWLTTAPIAAFNFRHSIAGSVEAFYLAASGLTSWSVMLLEFVVPAVIGNVIGGVILVAFLNYGQVSTIMQEGGIGRVRSGR